MSIILSKKSNRKKIAQICINIEKIVTFVNIKTSVNERNAVPYKIKNFTAKSRNTSGFCNLPNPTSDYFQCVN